MAVKYPNVKVKLVGRDGNAFAVLGACRSAAKQAKVPPEEISKFMNEAMSGDYNHLITTCMNWFDVE
jgi:hypothetical protein